MEDNFTQITVFCKLSQEKKRLVVKKKGAVMENEIVEMLNLAHQSVNDKANHLVQVRELVFERLVKSTESRDEKLRILDQFLPNIVEFQLQKNHGVHKCIFRCMEMSLEVSKKYYVNYFTYVKDLLANSMLYAFPVLKKAVYNLHKHFRSAVRYVYEDGDGLECRKKVWEIMVQVIHVAAETVVGFENVDAEYGANKQIGLYLVKYLQYVVLTFSEATDHQYRDIARSNCDPDEMNVLYVPMNHGVLNRKELLEIGEQLVVKICNVMKKMAKMHRDQILLTSVCINILSSIASLRQGLVNAIVPTLIEVGHYITDSNVLQKTVEGNLLRLARLPTLRYHAESIMEMLAKMEVQEAGERAISKSKEPRRKYVATPIQHIRGTIGKRTTDQLLSKSNKRHKASSDNVEGQSYADKVLMLMPKCSSFLKNQSTLAACLNALSPIMENLNIRKEKVVMNTEAFQKLKKRMLHTKAVEAKVEVVAPVTQQTLLQVDDHNQITVEPLKKLEPFQAKLLFELSTDRVLNAEKTVSISGANNYREVLLARLASIHGKCFSISTEGQTNELYKKMMRFVSQDYQRRVSFGLPLLYQEYANVVSNVVHGHETKNQCKSSDFESYDQLVHQLLTTMTAQLETISPSEKALFRSVIRQLPIFSTSALKVVCTLLDSPQGVVLGITTLRDLLSDRPHIQEPCLLVLLHYTSHPETSHRNPAIRCVANQLYANENFSATIESFAIEKLNHLLQNKPDSASTQVKVENDCALPLNAFYKSGLLELANNLVHEESGSVLSSLELYIALCAKNIALFRGLLHLYKDMDKLGQQAVFESMSKLVKHLKQKDGEQAVLDQLKNFPVESLTLICHVVELLCQHMRPSLLLLDTVLSLYESSKTENDDGIAVILIPILTGISRTKLRPLLPDLLKLPEIRMDLAFSKLMTIIPPPVEPGALLLDLHHVEIENDAFLKKRVIRAVEICLNRPKLFTMEVMGVIVNEMTDETPVPYLTMRTMIVAVRAHPKLKKITINMLLKLAKRSIWEMNSATWQGFIKCVSLLQPQSFVVTSQIPIDPLKKLMEEDGLLSAFIDYCSDPAVFHTVDSKVIDEFKISEKVPDKEPTLKSDKEQVPVSADQS